MICDAAVRHKRFSVSQNAVRETQGRSARFYEPESRTRFASRNTGITCEFQLRGDPKVLLNIDLRRNAAMFRDVIGSFCGSQIAFHDTQTTLSVTDAPQMKTGN